MLKMRQLTELTGVNKSTILYYIKEGLLPEPEKPKPNVHLYAPNSVQVIKFIKYLQGDFSYSIAQIKAVFEDSHFDMDTSFEMMLTSLRLIADTQSERYYSQIEVLERCNVSKKTLYNYINRGFLFVRQQGFSEKEVDMLMIIEKAETAGFDLGLLDEYAQQAKTLANAEFEAGKKLMDQQSQDSYSNPYELLFDIVLKLKPYIFNMHSVQEHKKRYQKNEGDAHESH